MKMFDKEFRIHVPAKGLLGNSPSRERTFDVKIPDDYTIQRDASPSTHGAVISSKNLANLEEDELTIRAIPNGVRIVWRLKNPHSFPANGRTGFIKMRLVGRALEAIHLQFTPKYQEIRKRFFDNFYYSGLVAESIEGDRIKFADQTIYMGQTLIFLASEVYMKRKMGKDPGSSILKIKEIFAAIDQLDFEAEKLYGHPPELNGFIVRDNIIGVNDPRLNHRFRQVDSDWQKLENAAPSGDQIFGLLYGLWFVVNFSGDKQLIEKARGISDRMFLYAKENYFELKLPNGEDVKRGSDLRWLSSLLHGLNKGITGNDRFGECRIKALGQEFRLNGIGAFWDSIGERAAELLKTKIEIPPLGEQTINSFAAHIILMAIAPSEIWTKPQFEEAALAVNHHLAVLIYAVAHGDTPDSFGFRDVKGILDQCPIDGPRSDLSVETGWQKDNRWIRCSNINSPGNGHKEYNGVDFLILHNLGYIVFSE